jgi:competence protein ComEC
MNGLLFVAIIVDRLRISMRVCAIAALVVLVIDPASLIGVSFQMSFGAVVALIAVYETMAPNSAACCTTARSWGNCWAIAAA